MIDKIKEYFRWHKQEKKSCYDWKEVNHEIFVVRKEKRFQNLLLNIYYWFHRNLEWIWKPYIVKGYIIRAWQIVTRPGHWSDRDIWSLDDTTARFLLPRLKRLKEVMHGVPVAFFPEGKWEYTEEETAEAERKWNEVLDKIIWSMDYISNDREYDYHPDPVDENRDYSRLKEAEAKCQEGLDLMAKYFRNLWD